MKTIKEMLREADPMLDEGDREVRQPELRRVTLAAALDAGSGRAASPRARSRLTVVAVAVLIVAAAVAGWRFWPGGSATLQAAVRFEVRLAETSPAPGLRRIAVGGKVLYLHERPVVTNGDISSASVVRPAGTPPWYNVAISFTKQGATKMRQATAGHMGQPMAILIDGQVVAAPVVRSIIGSQAMITGKLTKKEAERIANGVIIP